MDILKENFPQTLHNDDVLQDPEPLRGDRGSAMGEVRFSSDVVQCDQTYLDDLYSRIEELELFTLKVAFNDESPLERDNVNTQLWQDMQHSLTTMQILRPEISRLAAHHELFSDVRILRGFFDHATSVLKRARKWYKKCVAREKNYERLQFTIDPLVEGPLDPATGEKIFPWQSFCRQLPPMPSWEVLKELIERNKDMKLLGRQFLPLPGVLIGEHWRQQVERLIEEIVDSSTDPARIQTQAPNKEKLLTGQRKMPGILAIAREGTGNMPVNERTEKMFAFSNHEPLMEHARLMAHLENNVTTRRRTVGIFQATFLTDDGIDMANRFMSDAYYSLEW